MKFPSPWAAGAAVFILLWLGGLNEPVQAQDKPEPQADVQLWPDTQLSIQLHPRFNLLLFATLRPGRNVSAVVTQQYGTGLSWNINSHWRSTFQYRFIMSDPTERRHSDEHRIAFDLTPRVSLGQHLTLVNRARAEYRRINGTVSGRFRNRLQFEKDVSFGEHKLTPYLAGETYFDTRSHTLSRNQVFIGSRIPVNSHLTFDGFYMHQWDARSKPGFWHIIGTFLRFEL